MNTENDEDPNIFIQLDENGFLEQVDLSTGVITKLEQTLEEALAKSPLEKHKLVRTPSNALVFIPHDATTSEIQNISGSKYTKPYSTLLALQICERIAHGEKITEICKEDKMPTYGQLCRWRREHSEFKEWLSLARQDRADVFFDKALAAVENADEDRDSISLARLRSDFYKAAAKVSNPETFGEKSGPAVQVVSGNTFQLETGIRRVGDSGFNEDEALKLINEIEGE